ncbi:MAG: acyl-CoA acyltransferase [Bradyrhizobium sp.]|jgi:hypothetical protein|uniref:acyl-CoA acyltransferase n=1 Tax=Bradyrhizobium sp. TaxID=376 RepID=UPI003C7AC6BD
MIRCREIAPKDLEAIADLLTHGFVGRSRDYWMTGLRRQAIRDVPNGYPRFGYMLDHDGAPVGVLLLIYTDRGNDSSSEIRCNLSSWYVEPAFRNYAPMLTKIAQRLREVTYVNISAARWTWPLIEAQGFRAYCDGLFFSLPLLSRAGGGARVEIIPADATTIDGLPDAEANLLLRHARTGCLSAMVHTAQAAMPFVLQPIRIRHGIIAPPAMQLIYCRNVADYVACAGAIGRMLLARGKISVILDANGPVPGLAGIYTERRGRKYFKGPITPRLGDLADTELAIYGP